MTKFAGFPKGTFAFLDGLARHNAKEWFDGHRDDYEHCYLEPALAFVEAIGPRLKTISKTINYAAKVNGSLFRIQRDTRFSKDKRPYKTHLDLWFWDGEDRGWETPGYFLRLTSQEMIVGGGMHKFEPKALARYRQAVITAKPGEALEKIATGLAELRLRGAERKTVPRGFDAAHPRSRFLLHDGLYVMREGPLPKSVRDPTFVEDCFADFHRAAPVVEWLKAYVAA
jgi:uncharacterized protein (TIGR02453 family)